MPLKAPLGTPLETPQTSFSALATKTNNRVLGTCNIITGIDSIDPRNESTIWQMLSGPVDETGLFDLNKVYQLYMMHAKLLLKETMYVNTERRKMNVQDFESENNILQIVTSMSKDYVKALTNNLVSGGRGLEKYLGSHPAFDNTVLYHSEIPALSMILVGGLASMQIITQYKMMVEMKTSTTLESAQDYAVALASLKQTIHEATYASKFMRKAFFETTFSENMLNALMTRGYNASVYAMQTIDDRSNVLLQFFNSLQQWQVLVRSSAALTMLGVVAWKMSRRGETKHGPDEY